MPEASQVNSDGSCSHLYEIGEDDRRQILKRYRKVMNWCVSEDMRIDTALRNGIIVSLNTIETSGILSILCISNIEPFSVVLGLFTCGATTFRLPPV